MKKLFKNYFISHEGNHYRPHLLRETTAHFLILVVMVSFFGSFAMHALADNSGLTPAIIPSVLVNLTNQDRAAQNLSTLAINPKLVDAATMKSQDMAEYQYFAHTSPAGVSPWAWFQKAGYKFLYAGENLAINFSQSQDVETAWMNSPEHRANILSTNFQEIGIAATSGTYQGHPTIYVVQLFGAPAASIVPAPVSPTAAAGQQANAASASAVSTSGIVPPQPQVKGVSTQTTTAVTPEPTTPPAQVQPAAGAPAPKPTQEPVRVISQNPVSIAVQSTDATLVAAPVSSMTSASAISWQERFFLDPSLLLKTIYIGLSFIIIFVLIGHMAVEIRHHHTPSLVYGCMMLILMGGLYLVSAHFFGTSVVFA